MTTTGSRRATTLRKRRNGCLLPRPPPGFSNEEVVELLDLLKGPTASS
jgi:hypothetical protein